MVVRSDELSKCSSRETFDRDDTLASYSIRPARAQHLLGMHHSEIGLHVACRHRLKISNRVEHIAVPQAAKLPLPKKKGIS